MTINFHKIYSLLLIVVLTNSGIIVAQRSSDRDHSKRGERLTEEPPSSVYFETSNFISDSIGKSRLNISYRITQDFFVFVRNVSKQDSSLFIAKCNISVEVLDSTNVSVQRKLISKELRSNGSAEPNSEPRYIQGAFSFTLPPGIYTLVTEVKDEESSRRFFDNSKKITVRDFFSPSTNFSDILFFDLPKYPGDSVHNAINLGGNVPFGKNFDVYVEFTMPHSVDSSLLSYKIFKITNETRDRVLVINDTLNQRSIISGAHLLAEKKVQSNDYRLTKSAPTNNFVMFHIQGDTLAQGSYEFEMLFTSGRETKSALKTFRIRWLNMPRSLRNIETAVGAFEYIMTPDEFKHIKSSPVSQQRKLFDDFWKKKDPSPNTAYNETMTEYYSRVDYVMINFSTIKQSNGVKTELGKAYILYGPPTRTERKYSSKEPTKEIWYYTTLNKKLIFVDKNKNGEYKLIAVEGLM